MSEPEEVKAVQPPQIVAAEPEETKGVQPPHIVADTYLLKLDFPGISESTILRYMLPSAVELMQAVRSFIENKSPEMALVIKRGLHQFPCLICREICPEKQSPFVLNVDEIYGLVDLSLNEKQCNL